MADQEHYQLTTKDEEAATIWRRLINLNNSSEYGRATLKTISALGANLDKGMDPLNAEMEAVKGSGLSGQQAAIMSNAITKLHPRGNEYSAYLLDKHEVVDPSVSKVD